MRRHSDLEAAAAIVVIAVAALGLTFHFPEVPRAMQQGMGPERFPQLVLLVLIGLCVLLMVQSAKRPVAEPEPIETAVILTMAASVLFMGAVWLIGMIPAVGLAIVVLGLLWGERRIVLLLLNASLLPAVLWAVFVRGLKVPLPTGVLGRMLGVY